VEDDEQSQKQAKRLIELVRTSGAELFHDRRKEAYAAVMIDGSRHTFVLKSSAFQDWLAFQAYRTLKLTPNQKAVSEAIAVLSAAATYEGAERDVYVRVGGHEGRIYLDLGDARWRAVEIDAGGWRVVEKPPVYFRRSKNTQALPEPRPGGSLAQLRPLLNTGGERQWRQLVGWLLAALRPTGPYPVLLLHGEQGSAKTTTAQALRHLLDPDATPLKNAPNQIDQIAVAATHNWVLAYDNLSSVRPWLSDVLCQLATGGGFASRKLYTNDEEVAFTASRPVLLTGIAAEMVNRPDLLDRALVVELPTVADHNRRPYAEIWSALEAARPAVLGALLDVVSAGLKALPSVTLDKSPRMADFTHWVEACSGALSWGFGEFAAMLLQQREELDGEALALWSVWPALSQYLQWHHGVFEGTVAELLRKLKADKALEPWVTADWPRTPKGLGVQLKQFTPALRRNGVDIKRLPRSSAGHRLRITQKTQQNQGELAAAG
jgi:hypothetical protein